MFKLLRMLASAAIGLPVSLVSNAVAGIAWSAVKVASIAHTHTVKIFTGATTIQKNPIIEDLRQNIEGFIGSTWSKFGFYWILEGTKLGYEQLSSSMAELGFGDSLNQSADSGSDIALAVENNIKKMLKKKLEPLDEEITKVDDEKLAESLSALHKGTVALFNDDVTLTLDDIVKIDDGLQIVDLAKKSLTEGLPFGSIPSEKLREMFAESYEARRKVELDYETGINLDEIKSAFFTLVMAERNPDAPFTSKQLGRAVYTIEALEKSIAIGENVGAVNSTDGKNIFAKLQEFEKSLEAISHDDFKTLDIDKLTQAFTEYERGNIIPISGIAVAPQHLAGKSKL